MKEIWKKINGFHNYRVSNLGRVKSLSHLKIGRVGIRRGKLIDKTFLYRSKEKILKNIMLTTGYTQVNLMNNGVHKQVSVHRLVAEAFIPNPFNKPMVNHKNGIRNDNRLYNLEWCTLSENIKHAYDVLKIVPSGLSKFGHMSNRAVAVTQKTLDGKLVKVWRCVSDAVRKYGFDSGSITRCCQGKSKTHKGYKWEYTPSR